MWTSPITFTVGAVLTASQMNTNLRDDLNYLKSSTSAYVATSETSNSTTYTDLTTVGPAVSVVTDVQALVSLYARIGNGAGSFAFMTVYVTGATTIVPAADSMAIGHANANDIVLGATFLITGLTPGTNTFTAKYRASAGTGVWSTRRLTVQPA